MSTFNPCFCMPLALGVKIFAFVDMGLNIVHGLALVIQIFVWKLLDCLDEMGDEAKQKEREALLNFRGKEDYKGDTYPIFEGDILRGAKFVSGPTIVELYIFLALLVLSILIHFAMAGLAWMLFSANQKKNSGLCRMWFIVTIVLSALLLIFAIAYFINPWVTTNSYYARYGESNKQVGPGSTPEKTSIFAAVIGVPVFELITALWKAYEIVVVYFLIRELQSGGGMGPEGPATMAPSQAQQSTANPEGSARSVHPSAHSTATGKNRP